MKNFNEMPNDAILEIFNFLDVKSLKTATEVCKKWNKIISENSPSLRELSKLKFVFTKDWKKETAEMDRKSMLRLVSTVEFRGSSFYEHAYHTKIDDDIIEILSTFHKQVRVLILDRVETDVQTFKKLLSMLKLDKLIIRKLKFTETDVNNAAGQTAISSDQHDKVLQMLALARPSATTLNILDEMKYQIRRLALNVDYDDVEFKFDTCKSALAQFMKQQKFLKQFVVSSPSGDDASLSFITDQLKSSKLEQLGISCGGYGSECLTDFIKSQPALQELEIRTFRISAGTIKAIYETENLQFLGLSNYDITKNIELPNPCKPHANLKKVMIRYLDPSTVKSFDVMMRMFANIEELQINYVGGGQDDDIAINSVIMSAQKHLRSLKFFDCPIIPKDIPTVSIPSMERFHINSFTLTWEQVKSLLSHNPSLKELRINDIYENIESKIEINSEMLRELYESCPKFKKIAISNVQHDVIDETVAADSPIEVVKAKQSKHDCHESFTQSLFGRCKDVDMLCIWNDKNID